MKSLNNILILFAVLIILGFLYKRFEDKRIREENIGDYKAIQKYLLDGVALGKSKKPILWIHIPYEYNSRKWLNFGSRSSYELNQPYLYLTVKSIIKRCDNSFTICIIDDNTFNKLIPNWDIDMSKISDPILSNMRQLGMMKLLYIYGGLICPLSFVCIKDLVRLYTKGTNGDKMFLCETTNRNITSTDFDYYANLAFCGAPKECEMVLNMCDFIQRTMSTDYTDASVFLGDFNRWANKRIESNKINMINGVEIGTKTIDDTPVLLEHLMSNNYLNISSNAYGILIPSAEILKRIKYEWFARLSEKQVMNNDTIIGNYILLALSHEQSILNPLEPTINKQIKNAFVGFWRTPNLNGLYGLKPNFLGDNLTKQ